MTFMCNEHSSGPLCAACEPSYVLVSTVCVACPAPPVLNYLASIAILSCSILLASALIKRSMSGTRGKTTMALKITITYLQVSARTV